MVSPELPRSPRDPWLRRINLSVKAADVRQQWALFIHDHLPYRGCRDWPTCVDFDEHGGWVTFVHEATTTWIEWHKPTPYHRQRQNELEAEALRQRQLEGFEAVRVYHARTTGTHTYWADELMTWG